MKIRLFLIVFICLMALGFGCKKDSLYDSTFRGKIVIMNCGTAVIDIEGNTGTGTGTKWTDYNNITYNNAATITNYCYLADQSPKIGDSISFRISKDAGAQKSTCLINLCLINSPPNAITIYNVQKAN